ncbi:putative DNA ligase-like protein [compost metagenome]
MAKSLDEYARKRNFEHSREPAPSRPRKRRGKAGALRFVVQKHDARRLHYDFRLELDGVLKSWAVPKGPSLDPADKRLAVHVEDHPLDYAGFEGSIPEGHYGAGEVIVWDQGIWQPHGDPAADYAAGKLKFRLEGEKLVGDWTLVRTRLKGSGDKEQWLLIKERDDSARAAAEFDVLVEQPESVLSGALIPGDKPRRRKAKSGAKPLQGIPDSLAPQLATLVDRPPSGDWLYEIKFDGYRLVSRIRDGEARLFTRNGHDWTERLPLQAKALEKLGLGDSWLDGELVVLNEQGLPDFQALQQAFDIGRSKDILYFLFDLPFHAGRDLRHEPLEQRRHELEKLLAGQRKGLLRFSSAFAVSHRDIVQQACAMQLEGVIGKRKGSPYVSRRSADWIKLKCRLRQEFVIVGYTSPQGSRSGFGALLLAVNDQDGLRYAGRVGTGFDEALLKSLQARMHKLERKVPPLARPPKGAQARGAHWIEPELVGEVEFTEWTRDGLVRQAAFIALRTDKPASEIVRERPSPPSAGKPARSKARETVAGIAISNPQRVIDTESGARKVDLARYYESIADWILPELDERPVSLLRAPEGVAGEQFFQKHAERLAIPNIKHLDPKLDPGHARLMEIDSLKALVGAVQMGCIELHTWNATTSRIELPDRLILDLDPDPALPWRSMLEATRLTLSVLDELGLDTYLKTSGGKGMHLVVPLARRADWDSVKAFGKALAEFMARQLPERFTATMGPKNRVGKIFIDYLRNTRGASTVAAYSARARPGLAVSVPIHRDELDELRSAQQWNIDNLRLRLDQLRASPWQGYANRQRLTRAMWNRLGASPP